MLPVPEEPPMSRCELTVLLPWVLLAILIAAPGCGGSGGSGGSAGGDVGGDTLVTGAAPVVDLSATATTVTPDLDLLPTASDADGDPLTFTWTVEPGSASPVVLMDVDASTGGGSFTFPLNGSYQLRLTVDDGNGNLVSRIIEVAVEDPDFYTISGTVSDDGSPTSGLVCQLFFAGVSTAAANSATSSGDFSFPQVIGDRDRFTVLVPGS
jgi:hypothetical protein